MLVTAENIPKISSFRGGAAEPGTHADGGNGAIQVQKGSAQRPIQAAGTRRSAPNLRRLFPFCSLSKFRLLRQFRHPSVNRGAVWILGRRTEDDGRGCEVMTSGS
jgi:hypothetical protein